MSESAPEVSSSSARLVVARTSPRDVQQREVLIFLDGERIGRLLYGQRLEREIAPGSHRLRAYNTLLSRTVEFDVPPDGVAAFHTGNASAGCFLGFLVILGVAPLTVFLEVEDRSPEGM